MSETRPNVAKIPDVVKMDGLCNDHHVFRLGAHGTAFIRCRMPDGHDQGELFTDHQAIDRLDDGSCVIYQWPVKE